MLRESNPKSNFLTWKSHFWVTFRVKRLLFGLLLGRPRKSLWSHFWATSTFSGFRGFQELSSVATLGNGRNTVSRVLFRRRELTEPHWVLRQTRWVLRKTRWVRFGTQIIGWEELSEFSRTRWGPKNSLSSVLETVLSETVFAPFPTLALWHQNYFYMQNVFLQEFCVQNYEFCAQFLEMVFYSRKCWRRKIHEKFR